MKGSIRQALSKKACKCNGCGNSINKLEKCTIDNRTKPILIFCARCTGANKELQVTGTEQGRVSQGDKTNVPKG